MSSTDPLTQKWLRENAQPYANRDRTLSDVTAVLAHFATLRPKSDTYTFDDGRTQLLLCVHGLLPISFRNAAYNIPIAVWLTRDYPKQPPMAYVVPTNNMLIKAGKFIDVSGMCNLEYVQNWKRKHEGCSLQALLEAMQLHFSNEPPVYSKPKSNTGTAATPPRLQNQVTNTSVNQPPPAIPPKPNAARTGPPETPSHPTQPPEVLTRSPPPKPPPLPPHPQSNRSVLSPTTTLTQHAVGILHPYIDNAHHSVMRYDTSPHYREVQPPPLPPQSPYSVSAHQPQPPPPPPPPPVLPDARLPVRNLLDEDSTDVQPQQKTFTSAPPPRPPNPELLHLHEQVHLKLFSELGSLDQALALDAERLRAHQADLLAGEPAIRDEMARLVAVRDVCHGVASRTRQAVEQAEKNVSELRRKGDPEVDELVCSTTIVFNQLINLVAEDNAIEDTIYHLHRALNAGRIDLERFLRTIRVLAEEQFMKRALIDKIQAGISLGTLMGSDWA